MSTDSEGYFQQQVEANTRHKLGFYKSAQYESGRRQLIGPVKNGAPHIYSLGRFSVGSDTEDLGELTLPDAHHVDVRAVDAEREPLEGAQPGFGHGGFGAGGDTSTNEDGYLVIDNADFTGIEMTGTINLGMTPPEDDDRFPDASYQKSLTVSEDLEATFVFSEDGLEAFETTGGDTEPTPEETTRPATATDTPEPTASSTSTEVRDETEVGPEATTVTPTESGSSRGFFSNQAGDSFTVLQDPFNLTVGGFILSVLGITAQLLRGE